jgi:hypothetical protein
VGDLAGDHEEPLAALGVEVGEEAAVLVDGLEELDGCEEAGAEV